MYRKPKTSLLNNEAGQGMAEFAIIAITFLFCILGVIQLALCLNAYSLVRYAAYNAARAGIVHGADMDKMEDAARISLLATFPTHGRADHKLGMAENYQAAKLSDDDPSLSALAGSITQVKVLNKDSFSCGDVVTFDDYQQSADGLLTVQVIHNYELVIPLVNRILYYVYVRFKLGLGYQGETLNNLSAQTDRLRRTDVAGFLGIEYRIPLVAHYTMRMQSDYIHDC